MSPLLTPPKPPKGEPAKTTAVRPENASGQVGRRSRALSARCSARPAQAPGHRGLPAPAPRPQTQAPEPHPPGVPHSGIYTHRQLSAPALATSTTRSSALHPAPHGHPSCLASGQPARPDSLGRARLPIYQDQRSAPARERRMTCYGAANRDHGNPVKASRTAVRFSSPALRAWLALALCDLLLEPSCWPTGAGRGRQDIQPACLRSACRSVTVRHLRRDRMHLGRMPAPRQPGETRSDRTLWCVPRAACGGASLAAWGGPAVALAGKSR